MKDLNYGLFYMAKLANLYGVIDDDKPYDEQLEEANNLYEEFNSSVYNTTYNSKYDSIEAFLQDKNIFNISENGTERIDKIITKIKSIDGETLDYLIDNLQEGSKNYLLNSLIWDSSNDQIINAIKNKVNK